jgi:hypothetical protein
MFRGTFYKHPHTIPTYTSYLNLPQPKKTTEKTTKKASKDDK